MVLQYSQIIAVWGTFNARYLQNETLCSRSKSLPLRFSCEFLSLGEPNHREAYARTISKCQISNSTRSDRPLNKSTSMYT